MDKDEQVKALTARVAKLEAARRTPVAPSFDTEGLPPHHFRDHCGVVRNGQGRVVTNPEQAGSDAYLARMKAHAKREKDGEDEYWRKATEDLPPGLWRDACGIIRTRDGKNAGRQMAEDAETAEIFRIQREERR